MNLLWCLVLGAWCLACASHPPPQKDAGPSTPLFWPSPPDPARIGYVRSFSHPSDLGIKQSVFTRVGQWITGSNKGKEMLVKPFGIALDENDNLCITDTGANAVCFYDRTHQKWRRWEKLGRLNFSVPVAVAHRQGVFYVADSGLAAVLGFDEGGKLLFQVTNHLERPSGLAIVGSDLLVADSQRHCLVVFDLQGNYRSEIGRRGVAPGQFNFPTHLAADSQGNLLVTDSMNSRVQLLDATGKSQGEIGKMGDSPGHFSRPKGVAVDTFGHVYVLDGIFDNLQIFDRAGQLLLTVGGPGKEPGEFWLPNGIAISRNNEIYIADSYNHRIQVFKYLGAE